ncbi:hypothetical protein TWF225_009922 [Orbilia oligospora]|uniref:Uncharacterized protein n=1 Tax=Orbilia oligospora TaxID=2813651 RepID=A0A7C8P809_ORBOL|nr:hypothetical protein TWF751_001577 [Orbilia oligospora]KAF3172940.1 hypothetical protein TWF225_009922 [Orbilia oligospora]KAF3237405.1 hypothetical protein TWF217_002128 [Orbilia oligospora]KAF3240305.1 hypothetical protein TWF128_011331 [Orbilia oligospora]KAF3275636.1 hypothetical protein TWF132_002671 [Orbilia oligospora]
MVYIKVTTFLSLLAAVSAAPASELESRAVPKDTAFGFLALRSASPIHYQSLNASGGKIWLGKKTSTYCPLPAKQCPKGKDTSFWINNQGGTAGMNTVVPGGQQVYIGPTGELSYTQAHSAFIPTGSTQTGFKVTERNNIVFLENCNNSFLACPVDKKSKTSGPWQVFVDVKGKLKDKDVPTGCKKDCLGFTPAGGPVKDAVWQYA